jgi:hypothetical protein
MIYLSEIKTVAEAETAIEIAKRMRSEFLHKKNKEEFSIRDAVALYPTLAQPFYAVSMEIQGYESQLQNTPEPSNATQIREYLETARVRQAKIQRDINQTGIANTQHRRLIVALEDVRISTMESYMSELQARKVELANAAA